MNSKQKSRVKINEGIVWRVIDDEVIVLSPVNVSMHALTGCGSRIWGLIEDENDIAAVVETICKEYDVAPEQAEKDVTGFIRNLAELGVVEISPAVPVEGAAV